MKERPILFSAPMVRAILAGTKTQTRRVVKPQPKYGLQSCHYSDTGWGETTEPNEHGVSGCLCNDIRCPYGFPGDRLWVRETWRCSGSPDLRMICYRSEGKGGDGCDDIGRKVIDLSYEETLGRYSSHWRPSIHMPRWASRITLEVTDLRVERLQEICELECLAEGIEPDVTEIDPDFACEGIERFATLWDQLNASRGFSWDSNPWVWVVEFRRMEE